MKHRAVVIGAGRIGAGYNWHDDAYTHAGAYRAIPDRVELVGFVEPDLERRVKANLKWQVPTYDNVPVALEALKPDMVSICTQPDQAPAVVKSLEGYPIKGIWAEKPYYAWKPEGIPVQVSYMRRGDPRHQEIGKKCLCDEELIVYGKDDIHTRCHFEDLAKWWKVPLIYRPFNGPCAYILAGGNNLEWFDNGGFTEERTPGMAFKAMLGNLLDHVDDPSKPLWSPPV